MRVVAAALSAWLPVGAAKAQVVPGLGADRLVGAAGIETIALPSTLGLTPNPANIAVEGRWSLGLAASSNSSTDVSERSVTGSTRIGRFHVATRITSRWVSDIFDDPALNEGSDLRVANSDYAVGAGLTLMEWLRVGLMTGIATGQVLGTTGSGITYKFGLLAQSRWLTAGVTYGASDPAMRWRAVDGTPMRTVGTTRLALGVATPRVRLFRLEPAIALEWDADMGFNRSAWLRGMLSVGAMDGALRFVAGLAESPSQPASSYKEVGIVSVLDWLQLHVGMRFGSTSFHGNSLTLGVGLQGG